MNKKSYRLKSGKFRGFDESSKRKTYTKGELVPLTEGQFKIFKDKFELDLVENPKSLQEKTAEIAEPKLEAPKQVSKVATPKPNPKPAPISPEAKVIKQASPKPLAAG